MTNFLDFSSKLSATKPTLANKSKSFWQKRRYALYIYYNHAQLGAEKLNELGLNDIAEIIRYHHEKVDCKACGELQILCLADSLN